MPTGLDSLNHWLEHAQSLSTEAMVWGVERTAALLAKLQIKLDMPVITVGGTNGKGSTVALIEAMYHAGGYKVGSYSSPHLYRFNERVRYRTEPLSDQQLCQAFAVVEQARDGLALSYFEFTTVAALWWFSQQAIDVLVLEVGLGGRLDAVNAVDADVAVISSVALDHTDVLGPTREHIGREKAGIFRPHKPVVCGQLDMPMSLIHHANSLSCPLLLLGRDIRYQRMERQWQVEGPRPHYGLPLPQLLGQRQLDNAAVAISVIDLLHPRLPLDQGAIRRALVEVHLPGRFEVRPGRPVVVLDVAHNPAAVMCLADNLGAQGFFRRTRAVFSALLDKDVAQMIELMQPLIDHWHVCPLSSPRQSPTAWRTLIEAHISAEHLSWHHNPSEALSTALSLSEDNDRVVVFGSFLTLSQL